MRAADRGSCSLHDSLLSNLSEASLLDPFWKTLLTLAVARWCHFTRSKCCTKTLLVSRTRTHAGSFPLLLSWPGGKEKGGQRAAAKRTQPSATCLGSPVAANVVEPSDPDLDGNHCKHFPTRSVEEAASERASDLAGASRWGSFADCK